MLKHFQELSTKVEKLSFQELLPWEARWISHLLVKSLILENSKLEDLIKEFSNETNFPQAKLRNLRKQIKETKTPSSTQILKKGKNI